MAPPLQRRTALIGAATGLLVHRAAQAAQITALATNTGTWTDDLDGMLKRHLIRFLAPYSPTLFFQDKGTLYGTVVNGAQILEAWAKTDKHPVTVVVIPVSRDQLEQALLAGRGDIAAGDITVTEALAQEVAFTTPVLRNVKQVVVIPKDAPPVPDAEALSGRKIAARPGTAVYQSLLALNARLKDAAKPPASIVEVPLTLETEDMLEMTAAGLLPAMAADDWIANLWVDLIPGLSIQSGAVLRQGVDIAWAVRKNNPKLLAMLNTAIAQNLGKVTGMPSNTVVYLRKLKQLHSASEGPDLARFHATLALFQRYAGQYDFDELMLLAQSYQESRLDQNARSHVGAIGLMQLEPATGQSMGVGDIHIAEANVHAGAKYMRQLVDKIPNAHFDDQNRALFAFAAYNAGPGKIEQLRKLAVQQKLDPNVWFNNVERVAAQQVGQETVRYVRNIYKYYVAYQLLEQAEKTTAAARQSVPKTP